MKEHILPSEQANGTHPAIVIDIMEGALVRSYGQIFEGMQATRSTPAETLGHLRRRWLARHQLAQLGTQPESTHFTLRFPNGQTQTARLLSPPDMVAERDQQGQWQRRQRVVQIDGEEPYSHEFYQHYLRQNMLPYWLFRVGHLAMLNDTAEAHVLSMDVPELPQEATHAAASQAQRLLDRRLMRDAHVASGGMVNPVDIPAGLGHWEWLDAHDGGVAQRNGYGTDEDAFQNITIARGAGVLSRNPDREDVPSVVWYSEPEYLDPAQKPLGTGHWEFLTSTDDDSDAGMAALQLGGTSGLPNYPTASQIFRLRQQYRAQPREDLTEGIRLVWIPGEEASESEGEDPVLQPLPQDDDNNSPGLFVTGNTPSPEQQLCHGFLGEGLQPSDFDPTNNEAGGKTDQTAILNTPRYYTCRIPPGIGTIITLDRARPQLGVQEEHKTYAYTVKGWTQYASHARLDWSDKKQLAALARWRDQINRRNGWPKLRSAPREVYADDERRWIEGRVVEKLKRGEAYDIVGTHKGFNERFGVRGERSESGVASLMLRMKRHWLQFGTVSSPAKAQDEDEEDDDDGDDDGEGGSGEEDEADADAIVWAEGAEDGDSNGDIGDGVGAEPEESEDGGDVIF